MVNFIFYILVSVVSPIPIFSDFTKKNLQKGNNRPPPDNSVDNLRKKISLNDWLQAYK